MYFSKNSVFISVTNVKVFAVQYQLWVRAKEVVLNIFLNLEIILIIIILSYILRIAKFWDILESVCELLLN